MSPRSGSPRISRRTFAAGSLASGMVLAGSRQLLAQDATPVAPSAATPGPTPEVLVTGLLDPRFLAIDGTDVYFTEAGNGGDQPAAITMGPGTPEPATPLSMTGNTGKLSRLAADGTVTEIVNDFHSFTFGENGEIVGAAGLALDFGGYAFVAVGTPGPFVGQMTLTGEEGVVFAVDLATGEKTVLADLVSNEIANNPDPAAVDSNLYGMALADGQLYVADAGGNAILKVDPATGDVSTFAVTGGLDAPFFPDSGNPARGGAKEIDSVPSDVVAGPDGQLYVSFVTGGPFPPGLSPVYAYSPDGTQSVFAEGLTMVQSLAFDSASNLYASITSTDLMNMGPGQVVKVSPDGNHTVVVDGLMMPAGIAFDAEDNLYVVNKCTGIPGGGEILKYSGVVGGTDGSEDEEEATPVASNLVQPVQVVLNDTTFAPTVITVPANADVTLLLENKGYLAHDLVIADPKYVSKTLGNGQSTEMVINLPAGEHAFYCSQIGHRQMGMTGTIIAK